MADPKFNRRVRGCDYRVSTARIVSASETMHKPHSSVGIVDLEQRIFVGVGVLIVQDDTYLVAVVGSLHDTFHSMKVKAAYCRRSYHAVV
jgi:hypothetical protein